MGLTRNMTSINICAPYFATFEFGKIIPVSVSVLNNQLSRDVSLGILIIKVNCNVTILCHYDYKGNNWRVSDKTKIE